MSKRESESMFDVKFETWCPALLLWVMIFVSTPAYPMAESTCRSFTFHQFYSPSNFPHSEAWGIQAGIESIYPGFAVEMVNTAQASFRSNKPPFAIFSELAILRRSLARAMMPAGDSRSIMTFGYFRWLDPFRDGELVVRSMAGYSEIARIDDGDDSYFQNGDLSKRLRGRFIEIMNERGSSPSDDKNRQPLQDEDANYRTWIFKRRNYIETEMGVQTGSEWYVLNIDTDLAWGTSNPPIQLLTVFHPRKDESHVILDDAMKISARAIETKSDLDFMRVLYWIMNATPAHRGSALISKVYSMALYAHIFGKPMPDIPDGFDVFAMLEPDFRTFNERYRPIFFPVPK
ncbi:MAG: hypothetical protein IPL83_02925 [Bdellovibrionales bacterium]|nr:hypothetical protein [Bdellovibrionales bacterium]